MQLRPYQTKAIESINKRLEEHVNKQVAVLATGLERQ
jgi:superfamily II DNA or RNA helicase